VKGQQLSCSQRLITSKEISLEQNDSGQSVLYSILKIAQNLILFSSCSLCSTRNQPALHLQNL